MTAALAIVLILTVVPALLTFWNLALFRPPPRRAAPGLAVSVIIPARDEAANIGDCLDAVRRSAGCAVEVIVVDDHSSDATPQIVAGRAAQDPRVRIITPPPLPAGWSGKPHACLAGARAATSPILLFIDADVRLTQDAVARLATGLRASGAALVSAFPREQARSFGELLLVPLIHVLLLGYLPFSLMRHRLSPALGAGCGQIMMAEAQAYAAIGGHAAVRATWHDGVTLPRAFRLRGARTDLLDATALATCRMYSGLGATWRGFLKNAREGLARPGALPVWTVLLAGGFILPAALVIAGWGGPPLAGAFGLSLLTRIAVAVRFRQNPLAVLLTPLGVAAMLLLQWQALLGSDPKRRSWRGRVQAT